MSEPREPLRGLLVADATEDEIQSIWRGVQRRRARARAKKPDETQGAWRWAMVVVPLLLLLALPALWWNQRSDAGELRDAAGHDLNVLGGRLASTLALSDGSRIELGANSELQVLDNDGRLFSTALRRGRGTFEVKPGGPRRWRVEAGKVQIEVVGTRFEVERSGRMTFVRVQHGTVLVRGESVPDGVQKLGAGEQLGISSKAVAVNAPSALAEVPLPNPSVSAPAATALAASEPAVSSVKRESLALADDQRRRGDIRGAIQTLRGVVSGPASASERSIAAFTLGKLLLDASSAPAEAARAFRTCLKLSPPASVAEDALARLVEAEARLGNAASARGLALEYGRRYPSGRRLTDVRRWGKLQ